MTLGSWAAFLAFFISLPAFAKSLAELDRIADKYGAELFKDPNAQAEYLSAVQEYMKSDKIPMEEFRGILNQANRLQTELPDLHDRALNPALKPQTIEISVKSDRYLYNVTFGDFPMSFVLSLKVASPLRNSVRENIGYHGEKFKAGALQNSEQTLKAFDDFERDIAQSQEGKKAIEIRRAMFLKKIRAAPETRQAANVAFSYLYSGPESAFTIADEQTFKTRNPSVMLGLLDELRENPSRYIDETKVAQTLPSLQTLSSEIRRKTLSFLYSVFRDQIPSAQEFTEKALQGVKEESPFRLFRQYDPNNFRFPREFSLTLRQSPRPFHSLFKGIPLKECVGGSCDTLSPERWGTALIQDARVYHIERDGKYLGFIQLVPVTGPDGNRYASVDFGYSGLLNSVAFTDARSGNVAQEELWRSVLHQLRERHREEFKGIVLSESSAFRNDGVKRAVMESDMFETGKVLGRAQDFRLDDPWILKFAKIGRKAYPMKHKEHRYGTGEMIFDAKTKDAKVLRLLPEECSKLFSDL